MITLVCKQCGDDYQTYPSHVKHRGSSFCSKKCQGKWKSLNEKGENSPVWTGGRNKEKCKDCEVIGNIYELLKGDTNE